MIYIVPTDTCFWLWCPMSDTDWYNSIYKMKGRWFNKLLAVMVKDFDSIHELAEISEDNINFLKAYPYPFSVLLPLNTWIINKNIPNKDDYTKISIRVANIECQKKLIEKVWPIFLTSANVSGQDERYEIKGILNDFTNYDIEVIWNIKELKKVPPSDIFAINDDWTLNFLRQNHTK